MAAFSSRFSLVRKEGVLRSGCVTQLALAKRNFGRSRKDPRRQCFAPTSDIV